MPHRRTTDTELMDRILFWVVQLQGQWRSISTEMFPDRHRGWPPHPSQRSGCCSTIIEEREVSWSRQHPNRTGPSRWRGCNHRSHNNLQQYLADRRMANPMDPVLGHQGLPLWTLTYLHSVSHALLFFGFPHAQNPTIQTQDSRLSHLHLFWTLCLEFTSTRHQAMLNSYIF